MGVITRLRFTLFICYRDRELADWIGGYFAPEPCLFAQTSAERLGAFMRLLSTEFLPLLQDYIHSGGRSFQGWLTGCQVTELILTNHQWLFNCNTPDDLTMNDY